MMILVVFFLLNGLNTSYAQIGASDKSNLDIQPAWGPAGYDYAEYYYLPDINVYYFVPEHGYYYYINRQWFYSSTLPSLYSSYNFYNAYKIVINVEAPWRNNENDIKKYSSFKGYHNQTLIRDTRDSIYYAGQNRSDPNNKLKQPNDNNGNSDQQNHDRNK